MTVIHVALQLFQIMIVIIIIKALTDADTSGLKMDLITDKIDDLRIVTFNCRSIKSSMVEVNRLCESHDIVCLQEQWLLTYELGLLANIHCELYGIGSSTVDITSDVLVGRPYGGTAILYRKSLGNSLKVVTVTNSCITGVSVATERGPILLLTVYMPTEYNDEDSVCMQFLMSMPVRI